MTSFDLSAIKRISAFHGIEKSLERGQFMKKGLCMISIMLIAAWLLTGCNQFSAEPPYEGEENETPLLSDTVFDTQLLAAEGDVSDPEAAGSNLPISNEGWSAARASLVDSFLQTARNANAIQEDAAYEILGEVGDYTLVRIEIGGDCAVVVNTYDGYQIFSPTIGYPSETNLYLAGDTEIFTLTAAYEQGAIRDMGEVYALLPRAYQAGYDPAATNAYTAENGRSSLGFQDGVFDLKQ